MLPVIDAHAQDLHAQLVMVRDMVTDLQRTVREVRRKNRLLEHQIDLYEAELARERARRQEMQR